MNERPNRLRYPGQGTTGCEASSVPLPLDIKQAYGVEARVSSTTSPDNIGEANVTAEDWKRSPARSPRKGALSVRVFVMSADRKPLDPCTQARARMLLRKKRAAIFRRAPFTIILVDRKVDESATHPLRLKLDPGAKTTGVAILLEGEGGTSVVWAGEIGHRGDAIRQRLRARAALRRGRRFRKTRYRAPRFENRRRRDGWLPPSLESRVANVVTWAERIRRLCPVGAISVERVRFDTQALVNPEISGAEYQHGTLFGYEVREYLLEKWHRKCVYCDAENVPLEVEHIVARANGGSDRVSNLTLACDPCNKRKGKLRVEVFLRNDPERLPKILAHAKAPLKDAAAVNATRNAIWFRLRETGLPVEAGTGGRTKFNRTRLGLAREHWTDAVSVGASTPETLRVEVRSPLSIRATGHGTRRRCGTDRHGFPIRHAPRRKSYLGFKTGDYVEARIPRGKHAGRHRGRVAIRFRPNFRLGSIDVHPKYLTILQRGDGYEYVA